MTSRSQKPRASLPRYALTILSGKIRQTIDGLYPEHEAGFLRAILTGDKSGLEQADKDNFNRVGLGHVVVISGLHVTFLMGVLTLFLDPRKKRSLLVLLPVLLAFCLMTGSGARGRFERRSYAPWPCWPRSWGGSTTALPG